MKKGFTLAEVLITLVIVGVVAALTMPSLVTNYKKHATEVQFMKLVSTIQNATNMARTENGGLELWDACGATSAGASWGDIYLTCISPYMQGFSEKLSAQTVIDDQTIAKNTDVFRTKDGIDIAIPKSTYTTGTREKGDDGTYTYTYANAKNDYVQHFIDLNGFQNKPNASGIDQFRFLVDANTGEVIGYYGKMFMSRIRGQGYDDETWENGNCDSTGIKQPSYCGASILDNGGKIIYSWE